MFYLLCSVLMENNGLYTEDQALRLNVALYMGEGICHSCLEENGPFQLLSKHSFHRVACISSCTSYFVTYQKVKFLLYILTEPQLMEVKQ